jgi:hypothetical protein
MELDEPSALNAITPVWKVWPRWLRRVWRVLAALDKRHGERPRGVLMDTSMINSAGWSLIDEVKCGIAGERPHRLKRPYLLFEANFSGDLLGYLETFSLVDAKGLWVMWRGAYDFPKPAQASKFFEFVDTRKLEIDRCYSAYDDDATTSMVRIAIELQARLMKFDAEVRDLPEGEFASRYRDRLLPDVQTIRSPAGQAGKTWSFTAVSVIKDCQDGVKKDLERLKDIICGLKREDLAIPPNDRVPQRTHFARLTVADNWLQSFEEDPKKHDKTSYLMFSTWFDGATPDQTREDALEAHLRALYDRFDRKAEAIWGHCRGFSPDRGREYFAAYLRGHEVPMGLPFSTYPGKSVPEVRAALALAKRFSAFVVEAQRYDEVELKRRWVPMICGPSPRPTRAPSQPEPQPAEEEPAEEKPAEQPVPKGP